MGDFIGEWINRGDILSQINLLGFLCEAFGYNKKIYKDLDKLYQKRKYEFYRLAKENLLYNHPIVTEGPLLQEEYCKKALGIFLYQQEHPEDEGITAEIDKLIEKGWPYVFTYVANFSEISFSDFMQRFIKKNKGLDNLSDDDLNTNLVILFVMALNLQKNLVQDDFYQKFIAGLQIRMNHYLDDCPSRISLKNATPETKMDIARLKRSIFQKIGPVTNYASLLKFLNDKPKFETIAFLFDYEAISSSILYQVNFTDKDIDEILYPYVLFHVLCRENVDVEDASKHYVYCFYIRCLIKAYKQVKQHYFQNNKETTFIEVEQIENDYKKACEELGFIRKQKEKLTDDLEATEKKIAKLEAELEAEKTKNSELNSLREFVFSLDAQAEYKFSSIDLNKLHQVKAIIIGGHEKWQTRMKELLPNFGFIHTDMVNFDLSVLSSVDYVFFYVNYLNHSIYYRAVDYIKGKNVNIGYLNQQNENLVLKEIERFISK